MPNFYEVLGLASGAEPEQVKTTFHRLAKSSHPDVNADPTGEKRFKTFNEAYEILSDPERRAAYDLGLEHKRAEAQRRVRNAIAITAVSFMVTVGCGLYFLLPDAGRQLAWRYQPSELAKSYRSPTPQSKPDTAAADEGARVEAVPKRFEEGAWLDFEVTREAELAEKLRRERDETRAGAEEQARREVERRADATAAKNKEDEEARAIAQTETEAKRRAEEEAKQEAKTMLVAAPPSSPPDRQAECERALRLHIQGLQQIEIGNVSAARQFFARATDAGLRKSAVALAGTYDPAQLDRLKVLGVQPDEETARKWYEKARDLGAIETLCPEPPVREEGEFPTTPALTADKPAAGPDPDLAQFRAAYTTGDGLAYVIMKDEKGEHIYRYGDASRLAAKKDTRGYVLFTCNAPHVFAPQKTEDNAALQRAIVVKSGDPRFTELDAKYLSSCSDRLAKSAIPRS
jgi:curved DNA-binding protein CbpA